MLKALPAIVKYATAAKAKLSMKKQKQSVQDGFARVDIVAMAVKGFVAISSYACFFVCLLY